MKTQPTPGRVIAAVATISILALATPAQAQVVTSDPSLPVLYPTGQYLTLETMYNMYNGPGITVRFDMIQHQLLGPVNRLPSGPNEIEQFNSQFVGFISVNGSPDQPMNASGPTSTETFGKIGNTTGTFNTEMLSLNLSGNSPFGPFMIRESPTLASTGQTTITNIGGGLFHIDSFFDVFTELSIDGGNSWIPSVSSAHEVLMPEPSVCALASLLVGLLTLKRFRPGGVK